MGDDKDQGEQSGFTVRDRRRFDPSGEARGDEPATEAPPPGHEAGADLPVTFSSFLLGLSTQALLHLGEIPDPASGTVAADIAAAKQVIDILGVLEAKTRGNLDDAERGLMDSALYDLRMRYVAIVQRGNKEAT